MPDDGGGVEQHQQQAGTKPSADSNTDPNTSRDAGSGPGPDGPAAAPAAISIVISQPAEEKGPGAAASESDAAARKGFLPRDESYHEQCRIIFLLNLSRVCQQQAEEPLIDLGCRCRGELAKAHRSCIDLWFQTRGSNKCEICQQVAVNVQSPDSQPSTNYWVWRVDSTYGGTNIGQGGRARGCFRPLWVAFAILIGGLLLDVLISVSLGVSALPVNIIIGVLIILGLGTAFRLALECCHEWGSRRHAQTPDMPINPVYHPAV